MKTKEIIGEGVCGMHIELNVLDQHVVTKMVNEYDRYLEKKVAHDNWHNGQYKEELRVKVNPETGEKTELWKRYDWDEYRKHYPEPEDVSFDYEETVKTVMIFLHKLCSKSDERATIFETEDQK